MSATAWKAFEIAYAYCRSICGPASPGSPEGHRPRGATSKGRLPRRRWEQDGLAPIATRFQLIVSMLDDLWGEAPEEQFWLECLGGSPASASESLVEFRRQEAVALMIFEERHQEIVQRMGRPRAPRIRSADLRHRFVDRYLRFLQKHRSLSAVQSRR